MTCSQASNMERSQKQSKISGEGFSWTKQVMLDAGTWSGGGRKKRQEFGRYDAEAQYFEAL